MTRRFAPLSNQVEGKITFVTWPGLRRSHIRSVLRWRALLCRSVLKSHLSEMFRCKTSPRQSFNDEAEKKTQFFSSFSYQLTRGFSIFLFFSFFPPHTNSLNTPNSESSSSSRPCVHHGKHTNIAIASWEREKGELKWETQKKNCFLLDSAMDLHARFNDCKMIFFRATEKQSENMIFFRSVLVVVVVAGINTETSTQNHRDKFNRLPTTLEKNEITCARDSSSSSEALLKGSEASFYTLFNVHFRSESERHS